MAETKSVNAESLNSKKMMLAACDDGYAETKVVREDGVKFKFPSMVRQGGVFGVINDEVHSYETTDKHGEARIYTATGEFDIESTNTRFDGYPYSAENRVMVHHALRRAGLGGQKIHLATSLPVEDYFDGSTIAIAKIEAKSANLMRGVRSPSGALCSDIVGSKVYAEGVAAWVDFAVSDAGDFRVVLKGSAAVVDIGGRTTDTVKVLQQLTVEKSKSGTCSEGVLNVYDELAQAMVRHSVMRAAFPFLKAASVTRAMLSKVLATGVFNERGLVIDFHEEVKAAKMVVAGKILRHVETKIEDGFDLDRLLFVGGGSVILKDEIKAKYSMAEFVEDPEFANARGMLKMMKYS